ncbi:TolC family protein [uncultured Acetobacteroides sp.]|uniref:TolC family protein n=1 Tax=uncultured Acetobacteroides sp. TaxID=1760811 RepID=UPI0029F55FAF|nr:TolC family protein [uncultured Acetobacteroides sp.]
MGIIPCQAQDGAWSLERCVGYGVAHSPAMQREAAQVGIYRQDLKEAVGRQLPSVSASTSAGWTFGRLPDPRTNEYVNESRIFGNRMSIGADLMLFSGFSLVNGSRLANVNRLAGMEHHLQVANNQGVAIATAYYDALFRSGMEQLAREQQAQSGRMVQQLLRMAELGLKSRADVAEAKAKCATDSYNLTLSHNEHQLALVTLKQAMSFPQSDTLILPSGQPDSFAYAPVAVENLYKQAYASQPRVKESEYRLRRCLLQVYVAKGRSLPTLSVSGGYSTSYSRDLVKGGDDAYSRQLKDLASHYVEVNLRIPLFNGLKSRADIRRSQLERQMEKASYDETMQQLYAEVAKAVAEFEGAREALAQARLQQEAQLLAYQTNERKYADGQIGIIELHSSANTLLKAKVEALKAQVLYALNARVVAYFGGKLFVEKM